MYFLENSFVPVPNQKKLIGDRFQAVGDQYPVTPAIQSSLEIFPSFPKKGMKKEYLENGENSQVCG